MTQARVLRNTERVLDAATDAAATDGWAWLTPHGIAQRSGLSTRAVQARAADREQLALMVWRERAEPALLGLLTEALDTAGLLDAERDDARFVRLLSGLTDPNVELRAAVELLIMGSFVDSVATEITATLGAQTVEWCRSTPRRGGRVGAAQRAFVVLVVLGLLAASRRPGAATLNISGEVASQLDALHTPANPVDLPAARPPFHRHVTEFGTDDPIHEALLAATLQQVGHVGYDAATTRRIAEAAGVSETTIFLRHPNKVSLFLEATDRQLAVTYRANADFERELEDAYGPGVAAAITTREALRPDVAAQRAVYLEQVRVSWHDDALMSRQAAVLDAFIQQMRAERPDWTLAHTAARIHVSYAMGLGIPLLPLLHPRAWSLPFDVVTVPLTALQSDG